MGSARRDALMNKKHASSILVPSISSVTYDPSPQRDYRLSDCRRPRQLRWRRRDQVAFMYAFDLIELRARKKGRERDAALRACG
jgi:hypothetical protein